MIETGKILQQRYRIDKQIGQGGMGAVYVATDERFGSVVAIKETLCMDDNYRKAIEREARLLNSLKHAALPRVSDHFLEENGQFLVMEYIPGEDLYHILESTGKPFSFNKVLAWADQLLDALEFLHTQSMPVIHRDIKPQNLKLTSQGQIVLLDFGLAKGNPTDAGFQTAAKSIFGYSRNYASLEQIQGTGTDPRSDLYSLAATLYHLATGQVPEDALTRAMAVLSQMPDPLVPASSIRSDVPAGFAGILQKALDLNPSSRPESAREMRLMLRQVDAYAHLAADANSAETVVDADPESQKTRLMPGLTNHASMRQTDIKTEVLPAYISQEQETAIRTIKAGMTTDPELPVAAPRKRGKRRLAFAAAAAVMLICGIAAGAFVYNPALFNHESAVDEPQSPVSTAPAAEAAVAPDVTEPAEPAAPETAAGTEQEHGLRTDVEKVQGKQPSKNAKTASPDKQAAVPDAGDDGEFDLDGKTIYVGNVKVRNGKVETPEVTIDEKGITPKIPSAPSIGPSGMPDMRYLTPAQRRRMQELRRRGLIPPARRSVQRPIKN